MYNNSADSSSQWNFLHAYYSIMTEAHGISVANRERLEALHRRLKGRFRCLMPLPSGRWTRRGRGA